MLLFNNVMVHDKFGVQMKLLLVGLYGVVHLLIYKRVLGRSQSALAGSHGV